MIGHARPYSGQPGTLEKSYNEESCNSSDDRNQREVTHANPIYAAVHLSHEQ